MSGPTVGVRHRGKDATFDPASGKRWRTGVTLEPSDAVRIIQIAQRANMSVSGLIASIVSHVELDPETGLPPWLDASQLEEDLFHQEAS